MSSSAKWLLVPISGVVLVFGLMVAWGGSVTPAFLNKSHADIVNDTRQPVILGLCDDEDCSGKVAQARFDPGEVWEDEPISSAGVPYVYRVLDLRTKRRLGCLPIVTTHQTDTLVVKLSRMVPCQKSYDEDREWPAPTRACGVLPDGAHVDLAEGDIDHVTCAQAVAAMRRFRETGQDSFRQSGRTWSCYEARPDGVGWRYHCGASNPYVDVGAGRR